MRWILKDVIAPFGCEGCTLIQSINSSERLLCAGPKTLKYCCFFSQGTHGPVEKTNVLQVPRHHVTLLGLQKIQVQNAMRANKGKNIIG